MAVRADFPGAGGLTLIIVSEGILFVFGAIWGLSIPPFSHCFGGPGCSGPASPKWTDFEFVALALGVTLVAIGGIWLLLVYRVRRARGGPPHAGRGALQRARWMVGLAAWALGVGMFLSDLWPPSELLPYPFPVVMGFAGLGFQVAAYTIILAGYRPAKPSRWRRVRTPERAE